MSNVSRFTPAMNRQARAIAFLALGFAYCSIRPSTSSAVPPCAVIVSSTTSCNGANTEWTCTNSVQNADCSTTTTTTTIKSAAMYSGGTPPTATLTDALGNPVLGVGNVPVTLSPFAPYTTEVTALCPPIKPGLTWTAFKSNVEVSIPPGTSRTYKVKFTWAAPVSVTGGTWGSNNFDDAHPTEYTVRDAFNLFGNAVPTMSGWGAWVLGLLMLSAVFFVLKRRVSAPSKALAS